MPHQPATYLSLGAVAARKDVGKQTLKDAIDQGRIVPDVVILSDAGKQVAQGFSEATCDAWEPNFRRPERRRKV